MLASIGVQREKREFMGRWRAISASDEYLRTAKAMVIPLQEQALAGMLRDERWNLQNGGLEDLTKFLIARGVRQCGSITKGLATATPTVASGAAATSP